MLVIAWPACVRFAHACVELAAPSWNIFGTVRMPCEPSAWHDWQEFLIASTHCSWVLMFSEMPLPLSPVPGNWSFAGMFSIEYQYMPGYSSAASFSEAAARTLKFTAFPAADFTLAESASP